MIRTILADHITDLTRHTRQGEERHVSDEATLSIIGKRQELEAIRQVGICGYSVELDHASQRAIHERHNDPAILFDLEGNTVLQIFLYGLKPGETIEPVSLVLETGQLIRVKAEHIKAGKFDLKSAIRKDGDWTLEFRTSSATDVVFQYLEHGMEREERVTVDPGIHHIPIRPDFKDRFAICLSPENDPFGCMEIKHSIFGEVGASSGRFVFSRGRLWVPPTRTIPAYHSVVLDAVTTGFDPSMVEAMTDAMEVDIHVSISDADAAVKYMRSKPDKRFRLTTVSKAFSDKANITLISPKQEIPTGWKGKVSTLLFSDQSEEGFSALLGETSGRLACDARFKENALERLWCSASANYQDEPRNASYGISWSVSTMGEARGRVDLTKAMTFGDIQTIDWVKRIAAQPFCKRIIEAKSAQAAD